MRLKLILPAILAVFALTACGNNQSSQERKNSEKTEVKAVKKTDGLATRKGMEAKLKDLGLPIYPGAKFHEISTSGGDCDGGHYISYDIGDVSDASKEKVKNFYKDVFTKFEANGWKNVQGVFWQKGKEALFFGQMMLKSSKVHRIGFTYCED